MSLRNPPHPGLSLRADCLEPLNLSIARTAKHLGVSRKYLSALLNVHAGISPKMAFRLDKAFGGGAETWYRLQVAYDFAQATRNADEIRVERFTEFEEA